MLLPNKVCLGKRRSEKMTNEKKLRLYKVSVTLRHEATFIIPAKSRAEAEKKWLADNWGYEEIDGQYDMCSKYDINETEPLLQKEATPEQLRVLEDAEKKAKEEGASPSSLSPIEQAALKDAKARLKEVA